MQLTLNGKSIYERKWLCVIFLLILVEPEYFGTFHLLDRFYFYGSFVITIFLLALFLFERKFEFHRVWILLFYGTMFFATAIGSGSLYSFCKKEFCAMAMCLLFDLWLEKSPGTLLKSTAVLQLYIYINFITVILFPDGLYADSMYSANWFLGYKNIQIRTILPIIALALIYSYWRYSRINLQTYILIICAMITFLRVGSATSLVGIVFFLALILFIHNKYKRIPRFINLLTGFLASLVLSIGVVVFEIQYYFSDFLNNILQREVTFKNRTVIWVEALKMIQDKPIFGYGYLSSSEYVEFFGFRQATHPHNYILYILCYGGVVLLVVLLLGIIYASKKLNNNMDNIYSKVVLFTMFSFFVMGITEALTTTVMLYPMLIVAMNADKLASLKYQHVPIKLLGKSIRIKRRI